MPGVVIYATGSSILVDVEESLRRAGVPIRAGVQNRPGENFLSSPTLALAPDAVTDEIRKLPFLVPLFTPGNRQEAVREASQRGFTQPFSLIDPSVAAPQAIRFGPGFYVNTGCSLGGASEFGDWVFINRGASIGHHARFGQFVSIGPGAVIAGHVCIAQGSLVGAGAIVLPKITIGENSLVAAGAVVTRDVPDFSVVAGNPARKVKEYDGNASSR
ncbi:MAG TPA: acetyltransferase [Candidatus Angelobacter sp.]|nr:acetyltransferase [Candidatus Angelobacter sp.]